MDVEMMMGKRPSWSTIYTVWTWHNNHSCTVLRYRGNKRARKHKQVFRNCCW